MGSTSMPSARLEDVSVKVEFEAPCPCFIKCLEYGGCCLATVDRDALLQEGDVGCVVAVAVAERAL